MPGRTPYAAREAFLEPIRKALSCVATLSITTGQPELDKANKLSVNDGCPVHLKRTPQGGPIELNIEMWHKIIYDPENGPYRVTTLSYNHSIKLPEDGEVISFHWNPDGKSDVKTPHMHIGTSQLKKWSVLDSKTHLPTGRISIEQVVRFAIEELGADRADDWKQKLSETEQPFLDHRSWP
jgi:hypothetical protein